LSGLPALESVVGLDVIRKELVTFIVVIIVVIIVVTIIAVVWSPLWQSLSSCKEWERYNHTRYKTWKRKAKDGEWGN
jgi:ABC-type phosphate transport system permease subunit